MEPYTLLRTLRGFDDSINCLQFSTRGQLAAGGDDGCLAIFDILDQENGDISLVAAAPVTALLWHPAELNSIFVGYGNGAIFLYHIATQEMEPTGSRIDTESQGAVEALDYDDTGDTLAGIVGSEVILCKLKRKGNGSYRLRKFPKPAFSMDQTDIKEISPCSLHFIEDGRAMIVSYLYHGLVCWDTETTQVRWILPTKTRIARATISPDGRSVVVCNLCNGFDRYRIDHRKLVSNYPISAGLNISLPASFIHNGDALLFGSACGDVTIVDKDDGSIIQTLDHADDLIQAVAYGAIGDALHFIATGPSESGPSTKINVWRSGTMTPPITGLEQDHTQQQSSSAHGSRAHLTSSLPSSRRRSYHFYPVCFGVIVLAISLDLSGRLVPLVRTLEIPNFDVSVVGDSVATLTPSCWYNTGRFKAAASLRVSLTPQDVAGGSVLVTMGPRPRCFTVKTSNPPNDDIRRQWKNHLNRRRFSSRNVGPDSSTPCHGEDAAGGDDEQEAVHPSACAGSDIPDPHRTVRRASVDSYPVEQGAQTTPQEHFADSPDYRNTPPRSSPTVGALVKASWPSSDASNEDSSQTSSPDLPSSPLMSPPPIGAQHGPQSVMAVVTPSRKVRFLIERIEPGQRHPGTHDMGAHLVPSGTGSLVPGSSSPPAPNRSPLEMPYPPVSSTPLSVFPAVANLRPTDICTAKSPTPRLRPSLPPPFASTPPPLASTSPPFGSAASPFASTPPLLPIPGHTAALYAAPSSSAGVPGPVPGPSQPTLPALHTGNSPRITATDNTPRLLPSFLKPVITVHRFRAGEQDGYTRSLKTSALYPLSHPPDGEWESGDVFLHEHLQTGDIQVWVWDLRWAVAQEYDPHPTIADRYLCFRSKLEPSWVKGQTVRSYKSRRRQKEGQLLAQEKARLALRRHL